MIFKQLIRYWSDSVRNKKLAKVFEKSPKIKVLKNSIPTKYFNPKMSSEHLYLIDPDVAEEAARHVEASARGGMYVAETNAGLGLIGRELVNRGVKKVDLYETCPLFRNRLEQIVDRNRRLKLCGNDLYHLDLQTFLDHHRGTTTVEETLECFPKKSWKSKPGTMIIGPMPDLRFVRYMIDSVTSQTGLMTHGRLELYAFMRPKDYLSLTSGPSDGLSFYRKVSVLFQMFFTARLIDKYPREVFVPTKPRPGGTKVDAEQMYFVEIGARADPPLAFDHAMPFRYFVSRFFGRGKNRVIPTIESCVPDCGPSAIRSDIGIFTEFGELEPMQILRLFEEMTSHPGYSASSFREMMETDAMKYETVDG